MKDNYLVIMAGGVGSRFWPLSTESTPKQFLDILGLGKSLLQLTVERYEKICNMDNIYVVTNSKYKDLVKQQLPELSNDKILLEPNRKNTAPCIAYASYRIQKENNKARVIVAPSDHLILKQTAFEQVVLEGLDYVKDNDVLLTIGIKPTRPDTGYGYIQFNSEKQNGNIRKVKTFTEKPPLEMAKRFIESGDFYWNSGMFMWSNESILRAFQSHLSELSSLFNQQNEVYGTDAESDFINEIYPMCKNISIDNGVMEKAKNVSVILADLGWSDLGTWGSLYDQIEKDDANNSITGNNVEVYDSKNNMVCSDDNKITVIQGLSDYIVVDTKDSLMICKKRDEQKIKQIVSDLKSKKKIK